VKILYVGSYPRSGSTLLGRVLGEPSGSVCVGETRYLWERGLLHNVQCGCGAPFRECEFWSAVGAEAFGGWEQLDAARLTELDRVLNLPQVLPLHWAPRLRPGMRADVDEYVAILTRLYGAIARVAGAGVIVEISKDPTFARLLARIPQSDVRVLHLIRDSRAVANSWTRKRPMPSPIGDQELMPRSTPVETATRWLAWNIGFHLLGISRLPYTKLTYESFVAQPRATLKAVSEFAGVAPPDQRSVQRDRVTLSAHHIFSANPMRARTGTIAIELDVGWQSELALADVAKVTAMTWPLLSAYGYRIGSPRTSRTGLV
jgi:Sulfotransferase family